MQHVQMFVPRSSAGGQTWSGDTDWTCSTSLNTADSTPASCSHRSQQSADWFLEGHQNPDVWLKSEDNNVQTNQVISFTCCKNTCRLLESFHLEPCLQTGRALCVVACVQVCSGGFLHFHPLISSCGPSSLKHHDFHVQLVF